MKRLFLLLALSSSTFAACAERSATEETASSEDELRALSSSEIVGTLTYGQTSGSVEYSDDPTSRAFSFDGPAGYEVEIDVKAEDADAKAWLLAPSWRTLKSNDDASSSTRDSHISFNLTQTGKHYIAFREKNYEDASFTVSLKKKN